MNKAEQLKMFLGALSRDKAQTLAEALERQKLADPNGMPVDAILDGLRPLLRGDGPSRRRIPTAQRLFVEVFEGLIVDDAGSRKHKARISRSSIQPIWNWLVSAEGGDLAGEAKLVSMAILSGDEARLADTIAAFDKAAAAAITKAVSESSDNAKTAKRLIAALGNEIVFEDMREVCRCIHIGDDIRRLRRDLDVLLDDISDAQMTLIRSIYEGASAHAPGSAPYLILSLLPRFSQPWSVFGLAGELLNASDDQDIKNSDLALVGERLVTDLEIFADELAKLRPADYDPERASQRLCAFALLQAGMTKELGMRRVGAWGTRLLKARGTVSNAMEKLFARMIKDIQLVLPVTKAPASSKGGPRIADVTRMPDKDQVERVVKLVDFLALARSFAGGLGFSVAYQDTRTEVVNYLDEYGWMLVDAVAKASDPNDPILTKLVETTRAAITPLFSDEASQILLRRLATAKKRDTNASAAG